MAYIREKIKKGNPYYYIVEGRRENGRVKQVILEYIGPFEKLKALALSGYLAMSSTAEDSGPPANSIPGNHESQTEEPEHDDADISFTASRHGAVSAMLWTAQKMGIEQIMDEVFKPKLIKGQKRSRVLLLAMIHRAVEPGSKREFAIWCQNTSLPYQLAFQPEELDSAAFWEAMDGITEDEIAAAWNRIIAKLLEIFHVDLQQFHLDYSNSCTFINTTNGRCVICKRGHNKQKRDDLLQFSLAALTTVQLNVPIVWQLCNGNENDKSEFPVFVEHIRGQLLTLGIDPAEVTISFDGGSNSTENFSGLGFHFVCAHSMIGHKDLYDIDIDEYSSVTLANGHVREAYFLESIEFSGVHGSGVLVYSEALKNGQLAQMNRDMEAVKETVKEVQEQLLNPRSSLYNALKKRQIEVSHAQRDAQEYNQKNKEGEKERLETGGKRRGRAKKPQAIPEWNMDKEMLEIIQKAVYQKHKYIAEFSSVALARRDDGTYNITWEIDEKVKAAYIRKYYGKKLICTDHKNWTALDILNEYTNQECIENGLFRTSKDVDHFAIRPQYHWTDDKIRVHVFTCLAAITIAEVMRKHFESHDITLPKAALIDRLDEIHDGWIFKGERKVKRVLEKLDREHQELWTIAESIKSGIQTEKNTTKHELGTT